MTEHYLKIGFNPETNDTQFRALVEWCAINGFSVTVDPDEFGTEIVEITDRSGHMCIQRDTHTDCMIAAVAAKLEESVQNE